jgi:CheY-like chemotaxis protein
MVGWFAGWLTNEPTNPLNSQRAQILDEVHMIQLNQIGLRPASVGATELKAAVQKAANLLIVDDEKPLRHLLQLALEMAGHKVYTASDGQAALETLQNTPIDLLLLDIQLPDIDGYTLCTMIRQASDVPIILISAFNRPNDLVQGLAYGADDFIAKPFQPRELTARVHAVLRRMGWLRERQQAMLVAPVVPCQVPAI